MRSRRERLPQSLHLVVQDRARGDGDLEEIGEQHV